MGDKPQSPRRHMVGRDRYQTGQSPRGREGAWDLSVTSEPRRDRAWGSWDSIHDLVRMELAEQVYFLVAEASGSIALGETASSTTWILLNFPEECRLGFYEEHLSRVRVPGEGSSWGYLAEARARSSIANNTVLCMVTREPCIGGQKQMTFRGKLVG